MASPFQIDLKALCLCQYTLRTKRRKDADFEDISLFLCSLQPYISIDKRFEQSHLARRELAGTDVEHTPRAVGRVVLLVFKCPIIFSIDSRWYSH